jgi:hypothetical protein
MRKKQVSSMTIAIARNCEMCDVSRKNTAFGFIQGDPQWIGWM